MGGAPFNVARHLGAFGLHPLLISCTGNDALRDGLLLEMAQLSMDVTGIQCDPDHPTGRVRVILENGSHRFDILPDQAYDHICVEAMRRSITAIRPQLAYLGTLAQRSPRSLQAARRFVEACRCPVFLDINLLAPWYDEATIAHSMACADIVKLNDEELSVVAGLFGFEGLHPEAQAAALQQRFEVEQMLVTCGAAGCWMLDAQQQVARATPVGSGRPVVDTVGAGDAFAAVTMLGLLKRWDTSTTLQRAVEYAAAMCRVRGAAPPSAGFFQPYREAWNIGL
jgi:fructokinase